MEKILHVEITETLQKLIPVTYNGDDNVDDLVWKVRNDYEDGKIILDSEDLCDTSFELFEEKERLDYFRSMLRDILAFESLEKDLIEKEGEMEKLRKMAENDEGGYFQIILEETSKGTKASVSDKPILPYTETSMALSFKLDCNLSNKAICDMIYAGIGKELVKL